MEQTTPLFYLFLFLFFVSSSDGLKITTPLIHRDSIFSPHFNASLTTTDRAKRMVGTTLARHSASILLRPSDDEGGVSGATPELLWGKDTRHALFYVKFSIGDPPVPQLVVMDTGSSMLWVRCPPCTPHCHSSSGAIYFYKADSKTYSPIPCNKDYCKMCSPGRWPWSPGVECMYRLEYVTSQSIGVYATEQLTFRTDDSDTSTTIVPNVLFGCSEVETGHDDVEDFANGIMGLAKPVHLLGNKHDPLVTRLGGKFSYCVGSISNRSYPHNRLYFGNASYFLGKSTPFTQTVEGVYFTYLIEINTGGNKALNIPYAAFKETLIDSGCELTLLRPQPFDAVKAKVRYQAQFWDVEEVRSPVRDLELCFRGTVGKEGKKFSNYGFKFKGGAKLVVDNFGMFVQVTDDIFCLAIMRSKDFNVIGILAQQGYNVGYDMEGSTNSLYFQKVDCEFL